MQDSIKLSIPRPPSIDDLDLDDWMRSHISQASDDIGEVYHKLDYQLSREQK